MLNSFLVIPPYQLPAGQSGGGAPWVVDDFMLALDINRDLNTELKKGAISFEKSPEKPQKTSRRLRYRGPDR